MFLCCLFFVCVALGPKAERITVFKSKVKATKLS